MGELMGEISFPLLKYEGIVGKVRRLGVIYERYLELY